MFSHPYSRSPSPTRGRTAGDKTPGGSNPFQDLDFTTTRSPVPSPDGSPVKSKSHPFDDTLPTLSNLFGRLGSRSPQRPSSPIGPTLPDLFASIPGLPHLFARTGLGSQSPQRPSSPTHFADDDLGSPSPQRPSTPTPMQSSNTANATPTQTPKSKSNARPLFAYRKTKLGHRHRSGKLGRRPSVLSHRLPPEPEPRAKRKRLQERQRSSARLANRRKMPGSFPGGDSSIISIDQQENMASDHEMEHEPSPGSTDKVILEQLESLRSDQELERELEKDRQRIAHAKEKQEGPRQASPERKRRTEVESLLHKERVGREGSRLFGENKLRTSRDRLNLLSQKERTQRELLEHLREGRRTRELMDQKWREQQERLEKERKAQEQERCYREEQEHLAREQEERFAKELRNRLAREAQERMTREFQEQITREKQERLAREEQERIAREQQERERQARQAAQEEQLRQHFVLYEAKWDELRTRECMPPVHVHEFPWPVLGVVSSAEQITEQEIRTFLFHPLRPDMQGKTARDKVKSEMLRFHPDKFETRVKPKIQEEQKVVAKEIAEAVTKILTSIMTQETK